MKNLLLIFIFLVGLTSCGNGKNSSGIKPPEKDMVEVIYFHGKQRCPTCEAIEKFAGELINTSFAEEVENGNLLFRTVDISTPEGEEIADSYEVAWSSLFVNKWKDGKETRNNLTEFAFKNARTNVDEFKRVLAETISNSLN